MYLYIHVFFEHQDCNYAHVYIHMLLCYLFLDLLFSCSCTLYMYIQLYTSCHVFLFNMYMLCVHLTNLSPPLSPSLSASLPASLPPSISLSGQVDFWGFGVIVFECITGKRPFLHGHPSAGFAWYISNSIHRLQLHLMYTLEPLYKDTSELRTPL